MSCEGSNLSIWDATKLSYFIKIDERVALLRYVQSCLCLRLKGFFTFQEPFFAKVLIPIIKQFMSQKLRERVHLCGDDLNAISTLIGYVPEHLGRPLDDTDNSN